MELKAMGQILGFILYTIAAFEISKTSAMALKSQVFHSPPFYLAPGSVSNKYYYGIDFPVGHIAIKSVTADVVDAKGAPVPLYETYLHHWTLTRYYLNDSYPPKPTAILAGNSGVCKDLVYYYGIGSETRRTRTWIPDPYGIEVGDPKKTPNGYKEQWQLNVHAIDTRGVVDRLGCTECRCNLYNVTGAPKDYVGGLYCCLDQTQCKLQEGFGTAGKTRELYLRYTVQWMDWTDMIMPVRIYVLDVTWTNPNSSSCLIEYDVKPCTYSTTSNNSCIDSRSTSVLMPRGGEVVLGIAHQHTGGLGAALYGQSGQVLCTSTPYYGNGTEAGNEAGYIVGMSTCYPSRGSARIRDGEVLTMVSNYSTAQMHTGVMGLFYILLGA